MLITALAATFALTQPAQMSADDIRAIAVKTVETYDENGDGMLDGAETRAWQGWFYAEHERRGNPAIPAAQQEAMTKKLVGEIDTDGDGMLSTEEMIAMHLKAAGKKM